jgi:hypothetical protein
MAVLCVDQSNTRRNCIVDHNRLPYQRAEAILDNSDTIGIHDGGSGIVFAAGAGGISTSREYFLYRRHRGDRRSDYFVSVSSLQGKDTGQGVGSEIIRLS